MKKKILGVSRLKTYIYLDEGVVKAVNGVSFDIYEKETLGIIGESGCGKSVTAQSVLQLVSSPVRIVDGRIIFHPTTGAPVDLIGLAADSERMREIRGKEISMIFQEPMTSLSPVHTIGNQIMEAILYHKTKDKQEARKLTIDMIARVGIPMPEQRFDAYSHQLSGGLRQRAMIAMALSCDPALLIADEPTTALDVTIQAQILDLIKKMQEQSDMAVLYITHNLGVLAEVADRMAVMYLGKIVECCGVMELFQNPLHPYTSDLMKSIPRVGKKVKQRLKAIRGTVPIPLNLPQECGFYSRCQKAMPGVCNGAVPQIVEVEENHFVRCFQYHRVGEDSEEG